MKDFTLDHLIAIERVATRAVNAAKSFAGGKDLQLLDDLTTLISEVRHAASCTREGKISTSDLWVAQEARTDAVDAVLSEEAKSLEAAIDTAHMSWLRGEGEIKDARYWAELYDVNLDDVRHGLTQRIKSSHLNNQLVRTDN
jgi:hypothetical protein